MSNEIDKPIAGALRAAQKRRHGEDRCVGATGHPLSSACSACVLESHHIARESGLAALVEMIDEAIGVNGNDVSRINFPACNALVAAARRVREG